MSDEPLAREMAGDLSAWSRAIGTCDPTTLLIELIESSYDLPRNDRSYLANELSPGTIPFEVSFSEAAPECLRIDLEPWPNKIPPQYRRATLTEHALRLAGATFGAEAAQRFAEATAPWLAATHPLRFGAFFGASFDRDGLADLRIYFEHTARPESTPLASAIPGTVPIFESLALSRSGAISARTYLCFTGGLALHDLEELSRRLDLLHRFPELFHTARAISGVLRIPPAQSIAGVRTLPNGSEIKLDIMVIPPLADQMEQALRTHLRPELEAAYARWRSIITARLSVISVRVSTDGAASLNAYAHPYA